MISISGMDKLDEFIINCTDKILMLYFGSNGCSPCNILKNRINKNCETDMPQLSVCYIDIDLSENGEILDTYNIKILPTLIFVKLIDNEVVIIGQVDGYDWIKLVMIYNKIVNKKIE